MRLFIIHILSFIFVITTSTLFIYSAVRSYDNLYYVFIAFSCAAVVLGIYVFLLSQRRYGRCFSCSYEMKDISTFMAIFFMIRLIKYARSK